MKPTKPTANDPPSIDEEEITAALRELAVERGLAIPETLDEIEIYEEAFAAELREASRRPAPDLKQLLDRARRTRERSEPATRSVTPIESDSDMALAARNGAGLSEESLRLMDEVMNDVPNCGDDDSN